MVLRPLAVLVVIDVSAPPAGERQRAMLGWFGIRGIGSVFYLMFALRSGFPAFWRMSF